MRQNLKKSALSTAIIISLSSGLLGCGDDDKQSVNNNNPQPVAVVTHKVVGPVADAEIKLTDARSQSTNLEPMNLFTDKKGEFKLGNLDNVNADEFYLISASKGNLQDTDGDGISDNANLPVDGVLNALVKGDKLQQANVNVSMLSNITWEYVKQNYENFSDEDIERRLSDIANVLFLADITNDGQIDNRDILSFDPANAEHIEALAVDYQFLFTKNQDNVSVVDAYINGDNETLIELLDDALGTVMTRFPMKDSRSNQVKIEVLPFGKGSFETDDQKIQYKSDGSVQDLSEFYDKSNEFVTITATPDADTEILNWDGCDVVSDDKTQCQVRADKDHQVIPAFGYKEAKIVNNLVDLSIADVTLEGDSTVYVTVNHKDNVTVGKMQNLKSGDYIVGSTGNGFLRKVVSVETVSEYKYTLETTEASLDEVILQGTSVLSEKLKPSDVPDALFTNNSKIKSNYAKKKGLIKKPSTIEKIDPVQETFSDIEGVSLLKPADANTEEFTIKIGNSTPDTINHANRKMSFTKSAEVTLLESKDKKVSIKAKGEVKFTLENTFGMSYGFGGIESITEVVDLTSSEDVTITVEGAHNLEDACKLIGKTKNCTKVKLGSIRKPTTIMVGFLPVYIDSGIDLWLGLDGKISASVTSGIKLEQKMRTGFTWNKGFGFKKVSSVSHDEIFTWVPDSIDYTAEIKPYFLFDTSFLFYGYPGVALPKQLYVKGEAKASIGGNDKSKGFLKFGKQVECKGGIDVVASAGALVNPKFVFGGDGKKHNKLTGKLDEIFQTLNLEIKVFETPFYEQNFGGECEESQSPATLWVEGGFVAEEVTKGEIVTQEYKLSNIGDKPLEWNVHFESDNIINISKQEGVLEKGQKETITVTIDSSKIAELDTYKNTLKFTNQTAKVSSELPKLFKLWSDFITGNTSREIEVTALPSQDSIAVPENVTIELINPTQGKLTWSYPTSTQFSSEVTGYNIYLRKDEIGSEWEIFEGISGIDNNSLIIPNLLTNTGYEVAIEAVTDHINSKTVIVNLFVPYIEPEGDCQAFFTGAVVADKYDSVGISEAYVVDSHSEYVGAGLYPDNTQAFPKAVSSTFDGIAIAKGTKVTIWSDKGFTGDVLYEKVGPAIINNVKWINEPKYSQPILAEWKPELQIQFPFEVREWSDSNMHDWSYGSLKVECGY